jgi:hypothetical protein
MCHYITLVVGGAEEGDVDRAMRRHGRVARAFRVESIQTVLRPNETQYLTTNTCDCGTALDRGRLPPTDHKAGVAKLRERGWSQSKVDRWLNDKIKAAEREGTRAGQRIEFWTGVLQEFRTNPSVSTVGLLLHSYSGAMVNEVFDVKRTELGARQSLESALQAMQEDTLLMVAN